MTVTEGRVALSDLQWCQVAMGSRTVLLVSDPSFGTCSICLLIASFPSPIQEMRIKQPHGLVSLKYPSLRPSLSQVLLVLFANKGPDAKSIPLLNWVNDLHIKDDLWMIKVSWSGGNSIGWLAFRTTAFEEPSRKSWAWKWSCWSWICRLLLPNCLCVFLPFCFWGVLLFAFTSERKIEWKYFALNKIQMTDSNLLSPFMAPNKLAWPLPSAQFSFQNRVLNLRVNSK